MNMAICLDWFGSRWRQGRVGLLAVLLASLVLVAPAAAVDSWSLSDEAGHRFQASIFEQPFSEYPSGWRLRLNALEADLVLDHTDALQVSDAMGQRWTLGNRSEEIVPPDGTPIPAGSAQFDLDALTPRPSDALPLRFTLTSSAGPLRIDLNPDQTLTLHDLA
jgi:hypothetical protein